MCCNYNYLLHSPPPFPPHPRPPLSLRRRCLLSHASSLQVQYLIRTLRAPRVSRFEGSLQVGVYFVILFADGLHGNLLAVGDEEGSVRLMDTRRSASQALVAGQSVSASSKLVWSRLIIWATLHLSLPKSHVCFRPIPMGIGMIALYLPCMCVSLPESHVCFRPIPMGIAMITICLLIPRQSPHRTCSAQQCHL